MFAILNGPRSGSHLLMSLLNTHPALTVHDEILGNLRDKPGTPDFFELGEREGCLLCYSHFIDDTPMSLPAELRQRVLDRLKTMKVIHLSRDLEQRARSQAYYALAKEQEPEAFLRANAIRDLTKAPSRLPRYSEVLRIMSRFAQVMEDAEPLIEAKRWLEVSYEWLTGEEEIAELPLEKSTPLCEFLGVRPLPLYAGFKKIRKPPRKV